MHKFKGVFEVGVKLGYFGWLHLGTEENFGY